MHGHTYEESLPRLGSANITDRARWQFPRCPASISESKPPPSSILHTAADWVAMVTKLWRRAAAAVWETPMFVESAGGDLLPAARNAWRSWSFEPG